MNGTNLEFSRLGGEVGALICASKVPSGAYPPSPATFAVPTCHVGAARGRGGDWPSKPRPDLLD
jgi:hypothetical protein